MPLVQDKVASAGASAPGLQQLPLRAHQRFDGSWWYSLQAYVGEPAQEVSLLVDTYAHMLLLRDIKLGACAPGDDAYADAYAGVHSCYNRSASSSLRLRFDADRPKSLYEHMAEAEEAYSGRAFAASELLAHFGASEVVKVGAPAEGAAVTLSLLGSNGEMAEQAHALEAYLGGASGSIGMAPWRGQGMQGPWEAVLEALSPEASSTFTLDLNAESGEPSTLTIGVPPPSPPPLAPPDGADGSGGSLAPHPLMWSEAEPNPLFHDLLLANVELCGAPILGAATGWVVGRVDTASPCLSLPTDLFDNFFAWLPDAICNRTAAAPHAAASAADVAAARRCYVPAGTPPLPVLTFSVSFGAPPLQLPLDDLLLPAAADGSREFCVRSQQRATVDGAGCLGEFCDAYYEFWRQGAPAWGTVYLGTQVLHPFRVAFESTYGRGRVALHQKANRLSRDELVGRRASCARPPRCVGQQRYEAAANRCVAPDCATRYFQTLNAETQRCELSAGFDTLSAVVLAFLASLELYLQRMQVTVSGRARRE